MLISGHNLWPPINRQLIAFLGNGSQKSLPRKAFLGKPRPDGRPAGHPAGGRSSRTGVSGAHVVNGAEKKAFDRGGPVWSPRSNAANDRLGRMSGGAKSPQPKIGGSGGQRSPAKIRGEMDFFSEIF